MTKRVFLIFSHELTEEQRADLGKNWQVEEFIPLPADLQGLWSGVPPHLEGLAAYLAPLFRWLAQQAWAGDLALIQGEFGAVYLTVKKALELNLIPIYATTRREVRETRLPDGSVRQERIFRHVRFRVYGR